MVGKAVWWLSTSPQIWHCLVDLLLQSIPDLSHDLISSGTVTLSRNLLPKVSVGQLVVQDSEPYTTHTTYCLVVYYWSHNILSPTCKKSEVIQPFALQI
jgi:hypothetical protein